jgi:AcrR family transcriptional regulator
MERTGAGDPEKTVELLWGGAPPKRRGPAPKLSVPSVTGAAIELADGEGLAAVTMRALATRLGLASAMALYTYVPGKGELIDLMVDAAFAEFTLERSGVKAVADANRALYRRHPWLLEIALDRPPLGPGQLRKYELELRALEPLGLSDTELDLALTLIIAHARAHALPPTSDDAAWWERAGPKFAEHVREDDYPLASRVGSAQGEEQGRAYDPDRAYAFGVAVLESALAP